MLRNNVFAPIVILALAVLSAATVIITKRSDSDVICYSAMIAAGLIIIFVAGCYMYIIVKKDVLLRSDSFAALHAGYAGEGGKIRQVESRVKRKQDSPNDSKGKKNE